MLAALIMACGATVAHAGSINLTTGDDSFVLQSGPLTGMFGGPADADFSNDDMNSVHQMLHSAGISTDGLITLMLADTADGLGFVALLDDPTQTASGPDRTYLDMESMATDTTNYWINDSWQDVSNRSASGGNMYLDGTFEWLDRRGADAFAWTNLTHDDEVTFSFDLMDGNGFPGEDAFQFLTWGDNGWEIVELAGFDGHGNFAFAFTVVPLPAPVLMGLMGLTGVAAMRRRRLKKA
jgi:hypothetical protein